MIHKSDLRLIANNIQTLYNEVCQMPFPYPAARKLLHNSGHAYEGFIPDLDLYFSTIAGYCSRGGHLLKLDRKEVDKALAMVKAGFFEKHPEYKPLEAEITQDLRANLRIYENMRTQLVRLLERLQKESL